MIHTQQHESIHNSITVYPHSPFPPRFPSSLLPPYPPPGLTPSVTPENATLLVDTMGGYISLPPVFVGGVGGYMSLCSGVMFFVLSLVPLQRLVRGRWSFRCVCARVCVCVRVCACV